ncbi:hypothetical protein AVEN_194944-1 [Araneus ventricosus]|uniref:Uncharacterized protein n=1 Tax=Araneus ventricosus TaxID=182803 RepID=A0A4Y2EYN7_ARAVE|nr:hypothetical protein AVEN_194944-1 [Araneus ventricosus]
METGIRGAADFIFDFKDKVEITVPKNVELEFRLLYASIFMRMLSMTKDFVLTGKTLHVLKKVDRPPLNEFVRLPTEESSYTEFFTVASLSDKTPIEFYISVSGEQFLDLAHAFLHLQVKIKKKNGTAIGTPDQIAPINYLLHTLLSECSVSLNDKKVSSQANYAYRCLFETLLSPPAVQESMLTSGLFYKDVSSKHDSVELANIGDNANSGFQTRYTICKDSKLMDMIGPLHFDLGVVGKERDRLGVPDLSSESETGEETLGKSGSSLVASSGSYSNCPKDGRR